MRKAWIHWVRAMLLVGVLAQGAEAQGAGTLDAVFNPVGTSGGRFCSGWEGGKALVSDGTAAGGRVTHFVPSADPAH